MFKKLYIYICLLLSVSFWKLRFIENYIVGDQMLILTWLLSLLTFIIFYKRRKRLHLLTFKNNIHIFIILVGVFLSMLPAYYFWGQNIEITLLAQRGIYSLILLPALLFAEPSERDVFSALRGFTLTMIIVWVWTLFYPRIIAFDDTTLSNLEEVSYENEFTVGFILPGIHFIVLYLYYEIARYIKLFNWNAFFISIFIITFLVFFQNRSMILGALIIFIYSFYRFRSKYKYFYLIPLTIVTLVVVFYTWDLWWALYLETEVQFNDPDYNRWKSLLYYLFYYSPDWICYILGNGYPSAHSSFGQVMHDNFALGIYASDIGLIGMWADFGVLPILVIFFVIFKILKKPYYPLYLKFISIHIILVPTIFHFWKNPGVTFFVLLFYLFIYNTEINKIKNAGNYNS